MGIFEKLKEDGNSAYKKGDYKKAIEYYDKALLINRNSAEVWYAKALSCYQIGKYKDAAECHNKAVQLNPIIQRVFKI